ncbi:TetR family transcriptional regulator [Nonomuraea aridisoli]|uniref:TetR/AcrR family transcriptional regulator n=1 Tax=Nonomuraea aridisoli TaxID=2070368 RepID=A0A2W2G5F2_9ACTN|nr:TetR family transcriptional regulator [Nonomuraea aridisoli]PZG22124.1 TetR/AcrR family transcriptional regulator [Nonomuraea aridisoli]
MSSGDDLHADDLTAQARIRNAAIAHFARDGFRKANVRAIAAAAGVSVGLVFHHFGSKEGLRSACDDHVLRVLVRRTRDARPGTARNLLGEFLSDPEEYRLHVRYMVRAVEEDSAAADTFARTLVDEAEALFSAGIADGTVRPSSDVRALAVLNVLISLSMLTMARPLARALGYEEFGPEVLHRMTRPTLELFTRGLYTDDTLLDGAQAAWDAVRQPKHE